MIALDVDLVWIITPQRRGLPPLSAWQPGRRPTPAIALRLRSPTKLPYVREIQKGPKLVTLSMSTARCARFWVELLLPISRGDIASRPALS
jgi:hypothetical protein